MSSLRRWMVGVAIVLLGAALVLFAILGERAWRARREAALSEGIGAMKNGNFAFALERITPYAHAGNRLAQRSLGMMYARGWGVPVDNAKAAAWLRRAECGCANAGANEYDLALEMSSYTSREPEERTKAVEWLIRAAEAGNQDAQALLGDSVKLGARGLKVSTAISEYWRQRATER